MFKKKYLVTFLIVGMLGLIFPFAEVDAVNEDFKPLDVEDIVDATNEERDHRNRSMLQRDRALEAIAKERLDDMFRRQYFDHVAPDGVDVVDVANDFGYDYFYIAENLAFGSYKDSKAVVDAWMDSEGHRKNLLNDIYTHIGVAVDKDIFGDQEYWIAVQLFSKPESECEQPDPVLEKNVTTSLSLLRATATILEIDRSERYSESYRNLYNQLVEVYNLFFQEIQVLLGQYNQQVDTFNECVGV